jgi:hypothetical protein
LRCEAMLQHFYSTGFEGAVWLLSSIKERSVYATLRATPTHFRF